jgi:hypothetical protein
MPRPRSVSTAASIIALFAMAAASPGLAAETAAKPPQTAAKPAQETIPKEKLVCTKEEVVGSLVPKRVCRTQKQIDAQLQAVEDLNRERRELGGTRTEQLGMTPSSGLSGR